MLSTSRCPLEPTRRLNRSSPADTRLAGRRNHSMSNAITSLGIRESGFGFQSVARAFLRMTVLDFDFPHDVLLRRELSRWIHSPEPCGELLHRCNRSRRSFVNTTPETPFTDRCSRRCKISQIPFVTLRERPVHGERHRRSGRTAIDGG